MRGAVNQAARSPFMSIELRKGCSNSIHSWTLLPTDFCNRQVCRSSQPSTDSSSWNVLVKNKWLDLRQKADRDLSNEEKISLL